MTAARDIPDPDAMTIALLPGWVTSVRAETLEDVAFLSGVALATLHLALRQPGLPHALLRQRLALEAAEACVALSGRRETAADLRDAVHLLRAGDHPGPAGAVYLAWQRSVARPISLRALQQALPAQGADQIAVWLDAGQGAPIDQAARVLEAVLSDLPRGEDVALILADAALARALGWDHILPLLAGGLKSRDLRMSGEDLRAAVHGAVLSGCRTSVHRGADLSRRVARLESVAPKLRAKGAHEAVGLFLTRDVLAPAALTSLMSDRAARRFCDRLVDLGVVREMTGRDSFRLYGV